MTLTVRSASVTGAITAARALTHAEMDANWAHVIESSNQNFTPSGIASANRASRSIAGKSEDFISLLDAKNDDGTSVDRTGATDCSTAFAAALTAASGKALYVPAGTYLIGASLTIPASTLVFGTGRRGTILKKGFSGDLIGSMAGYAQLRDLKLDGNRGSFTGRNIVISTGAAQGIDSIESVDSESYDIEYTVVDEGSQSYIVNSQLGGRATHTAVKYPTSNEVGNPRAIINCQGGGSILVDFAGASDCYFIGNFTNNLTFSDDSSICIIQGNRIALEGGTMTVKGGGHVITGNSIAGTVVLASGANGCHIRVNEQTTITDNSGETQNRFDVPRATYTPTWDQASGDQPSVGDGTLTGVYSRDGTVATVFIKLTMGSTTDTGNSATGYRFSLPYQVYSQGSPTGVAYIRDAGTGNVTTHQVDFNAGASTCTILTMSGGNVRDGSPLTWASGDSITIQGSYLCD